MGPRATLRPPHKALRWGGGLPTTRPDGARSRLEHVRVEAVRGRLGGRAGYEQKASHASKGTTSPWRGWRAGERLMSSRRKSVALLLAGARGPMAR